jgi:hypothetical protein
MLIVLRVVLGVTVQEIDAALILVLNSTANEALVYWFSKMVTILRVPSGNRK